MERLKANIDLDGRVPVWWMDTDTSGTLKLTADQAEEIGRIGTMARVRAGGPGPESEDAAAFREAADIAESLAKAAGHCAACDMALVIADEIRRKAERLEGD